MSGSNIWDQVLARIETKVNRHSFYTWFKPTAFVSDLDGGIRVRVPNALFRDWLTKHYAAVIEEALGEVQRSGAPVAFVTEDVTPPAVPEPVHEPETDDAASDDALGILSPRYSFDTFIVGPTNQFAHAACRAVRVATPCTGPGTGSSPTRSSSTAISSAPARPSSATSATGATSRWSTGFPSPPASARGK